MTSAMPAALIPTESKLLRISETPSSRRKRESQSTTMLTMSASLRARSGAARKWGRKYMEKSAVSWPFGDAQKRVEKMRARFPRSIAAAFGGGLAGQVASGVQQTALPRRSQEPVFCRPNRCAVCRDEVSGNIGYVGWLEHAEILRRIPNC